MEIKSAEIIVRDVGLGDSIYVKVKRDNDVEVSYLIDTGCLRNKKIYDEQLQMYSIENIDTLILTHKHTDHISATIHVIERYHVKNIVLSFRDSFFACDSNKKISNYLREIYEKKHSAINIFDIKDCMAMSHILDFHVLYPREENKAYPDNINRNSIVLLLCVGKCGVLFTGDSTCKEEPLVLHGLKMYGLESVQVLKVPHHGSRTSTSSDFLNKLSDLKYAIVSASALRMKKLPSEDFEDRWRHFNETHSCDMFYTEDGNIGQNVQLTIDGVSGCVRVCNCQPKHF